MQLGGMRVEDTAPGIWFWLDPRRHPNFNVVFHAPEGDEASQRAVHAKLTRKLRPLASFAVYVSPSKLTLQVEYEGGSATWSLVEEGGFFRYPLLEEGSGPG